MGSLTLKPSTAQAAEKATLRVDKTPPNAVLADKIARLQRDS
jgi:hypothetical protein